MHVETLSYTNLTDAAQTRLAGRRVHKRTTSRFGDCTETATEVSHDVPSPRMASTS
jgi:hypothetical protein